MTARLLPGVTPAFEVLPHRPHRHRDTKLLGDQVAHGTPRPQRRSNAELLRSFAAEQLLNVAALLVREGAAGAERAPATFMREGADALVGIGRPPAADRFAGHTEEVGHFAFSVTQFTTPHGTQAEGFENFIRQLASVGQGYGHDTLLPAIRRLKLHKGSNHQEESEQVSCQGNTELPKVGDWVIRVRLLVVVPRNRPPRFSHVLGSAEVSRLRRDW